MALKRIQITPQALEENFNYWKSNWKDIKEPSDEVKNFVNSIMTTHTFPYEKIFTNDYKYKPYERIFLQSEGLLSDGYRDANNLFEKKEPRRKMSRARKFNLNNYVFAYLSIHDPYYAKNKTVKINCLPIGIFIKKDEETEAFDFCLPTRRDIDEDNVYVDQLNLIREFLSAKRVRELICYQIFNEKTHSNDPWHYYGTPNYWTDKNYAGNSWKYRAEFHYYERVEIEKIEAVLWPIWKRFKGSEKLLSNSELPLFILKKDFPDCKFIPYELDLFETELSFIKASYNVISYYLKFDKQFPLTVEMAIKELGENP